MPVPGQDLVADQRLAADVAAARAGDNAAWTRLIDRYDRTLRVIAGSYRLNWTDVDDVVQTTWTRLYQHIDSLREPTAIIGWLATTTRREALRHLRTSAREQPSADARLQRPACRARPEAAVLATEERAVLGRAIAALPDKDRRLMTLLVAMPDASYLHISRTLDMPVGSIGPIRARGLARLGRDPSLRSHHFGVARLTTRRWAGEEGLSGRTATSSVPRGRTERLPGVGTRPTPEAVRLAQQPRSSYQ